MLFKPNKDDIAAGLNFACAVLGIGSLAMGRNFGRAGFWPGTIALMLMFSINLYSTVALSKCMRMTPAHVRTYGDLGEHVGGAFGRYAVIVTQFGTCLILPIAFLVLGGNTLLPYIFKIGAANVYIPLMAITLLPVVLIRTLKEAAWAALLGTAGAVFGDVFAVIDSMMTETVHHSEPKLDIDNVLCVFGSMTMAFGGAVVVPAIQREHANPERMPTIVLFVLLIITLAYFFIGL